MGQTARTTDIAGPLPHKAGSGNQHPVLRTLQGQVSSTSYAQSTDHTMWGSTLLQVNFASSPPSQPLHRDAVEIEHEVHDHQHVAGHGSRLLEEVPASSRITRR